MSNGPLLIFTPAPMSRAQRFRHAGLPARVVVNSSSRPAINGRWVHGLSCIAFATHVEQPFGFPGFVKLPAPVPHITAIIALLLLAVGARGAIRAGPPRSPASWGARFYVEAWCQLFFFTCSSGSPQAFGKIPALKQPARRRPKPAVPRLH